MKKLRPAFTLMFLFFTCICFSQEKITPTCKEVMLTGKFKYMDASDTSAYVIMQGKKQKDYSGNGKYVIESKVTWIDECSYKLKMKKNTIPDFPFKSGDQMLVNVTKIDGAIIYYTATINGKSWNGKFMKVSD